MVRKSELTDELIFFAEERANRPHSQENNACSYDYCPFCPGNEHMTPPDIYRSDDGRIRIFKNLYPFFEDTDTGVNGYHHVLVDTDVHSERLFEFPDIHIKNVLSALRDHSIKLSQNENIKYIQIFKNDGLNSGASQAHSHWQIAAMPMMPPKISLVSKNAEKYYKKTGECYLCHMPPEELILFEDEKFVAFAPYDSKFSYEIKIIPKNHIHTINSFDDYDLFLLGVGLRRILGKLAKLTDNGSYNICMYSAHGSDCQAYEHFYLQIIPRIGNIAGFEFSTGCFINSVLPENAAKAFREI